MTFNRHASRVFNHGKTAHFRYLTTLKQKIELVQSNHADILYVIDFTKQFAALSPKAFVKQYVIGLNAKIVVAGFDYTFGKGGNTTIDSLAQISGGKVQTVTVHELASDQQKISSTRIRHLVSLGKLPKQISCWGIPTKQPASWSTRKVMAYQSLILQVACSSCRKPANTAVKSELPIKKLPCL